MAKSKPAAAVYNSLIDDAIAETTADVVGLDAAIAKRRDHGMPSKRETIRSRGVGGEREICSKLTTIHLYQDQFDAIFAIESHLGKRRITSDLIRAALDCYFRDNGQLLGLEPDQVCDAALVKHPFDSIVGD